MSDMITAEEAGKLLDDWENPETGYGRDERDAVAPDLARTVIALHAQLADAKAAQAMVVERAAGIATSRFLTLDQTADAIRALADPSGVEALGALREEATSREMEWAAIRDELVADRDRLAAANAALEAQVARLVEVGRKLFLAARELRDYASYAEIVGGVSVNRPQIRKWCDTIAEIVNTLPDDENYERSFAALAEVQADARRDGEGGE